MRGSSFSSREGTGSPLQYCCLENPMEGGDWWAAVRGVAKSWTWLSDFTFTFHFHALEKEMATHSSVLAWRIPGTGEPGGLPSMGLCRVGHDWSDLAAAAAVSLQFAGAPLPLAQNKVKEIYIWNIMYIWNINNICQLQLKCFQFSPFTHTHALFFFSS